MAQPLKKFEIALVGDFQCGKSTFFNALCNGREIAPRGCGIKTSGCAVSVSVLARGKEYAELEWYSNTEFTEKITRAGNICKSEDAGIEVERIRALWRKFNRSKNLKALRQIRKMNVSCAAKTMAYPKDWEKRWSSEKACGGYSDVNEVAFLFLKKVVFHLKVSLPMGCMFTDTPGFNAGVWDLVTAQDSMREADAIMCIMDGRERAVSNSYFTAFNWMKAEGVSAKLFFAVNGAIKSRVNEFAKVNKAEIKKRGFPLQQKEIPVFSALLAFLSKDKKALLREKGEAISNWLDLDIIEESGKIKKLCTNVSGIYESSNAANVLECLEQFVMEIKKNPVVETNIEGGVVNSPQGLVPAIGFEWLNPANPNDMRVKWVPGTRNPDWPHIYASEIEKEFCPDDGYRWASEKPNDYSVVWSPGIRHPFIENIEADQTEGEWRPADGYDWVDAKNKKTRLAQRVKWCAHRSHPYLNGVMASIQERTWELKPGYKWADNTSDETRFRYGAIWEKGLFHPAVAHVVSAHNEGDWDPEPGYQWNDWFDWLMHNKKPSVKQKLKSGVRWWPGTPIPGLPHVEAGDVEGEFKTESGWRWLNPSTPGDFRVVEANLLEKGARAVLGFLDDLFS